MQAGVDGAELIVAQAGGEPLIAAPFHRIFEACERKGVPVSFATNGILLRDEALVRRLVRAHVTIMISIDGARPETYHFVRPLQDWDRLLEALALVQRCLQEAEPERRGSLQILLHQGKTPDARESVSFTKVTDAGLEHVVGLSGLKTLRLVCTRVTDGGLEHLETLTSLRELDLRSSQISDVAVTQLSKALPECKIHR